MTDVLDIQEEDVTYNKKEMKQLKKPIKKRMKLAYKNKDYSDFECCMDFLMDYDKSNKTDKYNKYIKDLKINKDFLNVIQKNKDMKETIKELKEINYLYKERLDKLEDLNFNLYDTYEKVISKKLMTHINKYVDTKLNEMRREIIKEKAKPAKKRIKGNPVAKTPAI